MLRSRARARDLLSWDIPRVGTIDEIVLPPSVLRPLRKTQARSNIQIGWHTLSPRRAWLARVSENTKPIAEPLGVPAVASCGTLIGLWEGPLRTLASAGAPPDKTANQDSDESRELQLVLDPESR